MTDLATMIAEYGAAVEAMQWLKHGTELDLLPRRREAAIMFGYEETRFDNLSWLQWRAIRDQYYNRIYRLDQPASAERDQWLQSHRDVVAATLA